MDELILTLVLKYPNLAAFVAFVGLARLVIKPLMTFLHEFVLVTPSDKDNEFLKRIEDSKVTKAALYVLDYLGSIKVKK